MKQRKTKRKKALCRRWKKFCALAGTDEPAENLLYSPLKQ